MDIPGWLETAADRAPPDSSDHRTVPEASDQSARLGHHYRRKRKRVSSDSSIIAPHKNREGAASLRAASPGRNLDIPRANVPAQSSVCSGNSHARPQAPKYEKRARRKTKPDRYDAKRKKPKEDHKAWGDAKPTRRKSDRKHDGSRTTGLVHSFHLKNGPKNSRLTLKPEVNAGLFKHGRASAQIAGRGSGCMRTESPRDCLWLTRRAVPDLVFNEMKFLQRPTEHQDQPFEDDEPRLSKREGRKRARDEEISAYFTAPKQPDSNGPREASDHAQRRRKDREADRNPTKHRHRHHTSHSVVSLPKQPFLGFGSKGAPPEGRESKIDTATCYTWSESAPRRSPSPPGARREACHPVIETEQERRPQRTATAGSQAHPLQPHHSNAASDRDATEGDQHGQWLQSRRNRGPTLVEVYQPPVDFKNSIPPANTSPTITTFQSLPRQKGDAQEQHELRSGRYRCSAGTHDSYRTSDILNVHDQLHRPAQHQPRSQSDKENNDPDSSFSIDKVLLRVRDAVLQPTVDSYTPPNDTINVPLPPGELPRQSVGLKERTVLQPIQDLANRFPYPEQQQQRVPQRLYEYHKLSQSARPYSQAMDRRSERSLHSYHQALERDDRNLLRPATWGIADELLDVIPVYGPDWSDGIPGTEQQAPQAANRSMSLPQSGALDAQALHSEREEALQWTEGEYNFSQPLSLDALSNEREPLRQSSGARGGASVDTGMPGFWKPNRLY